MRIKRYHDTIETQAAELLEWNRTLEARVGEQVEHIDRISRLKRFLPPQVVEMVTTSGDESFLESHRREIAVVFCDLRGFTPFAETVEPEEVSAVLADYYRALGDIVHRFEGTLERFLGDGLMVFFNDPVPCEDAPERAVRMAVAMRAPRVRTRRSGGPSTGTTSDSASASPRDTPRIGVIGFEGRLDYAAIGTVSNLAARLCAEAAPGQILVSQRVHAAAKEIVVAEPMEELALRGFSRPVRAHRVIGLNAARTST